MDCEMFDWLCSLKRYGISPAYECPETCDTCPFAITLWLHEEDRYKWREAYVNAESDKFWAETKLEIMSWLYAEQGEKFVEVMKKIEWQIGFVVRKRDGTERILHRCPLCSAIREDEDEHDEGCFFVQALSHLQRGPANNE